MNFYLLLAIAVLQAVDIVLKALSSRYSWAKKAEALVEKAESKIN